MSSLPQNGVVAGSVLPLSEGDVGPCSQLCSMSAVGSGTPNSARMQVLSCGDAEGEGRSLTIGTGKSVLEQRDFLLSYTEKHANNTCSPSKQEGQGGTEEEGAATGSWLCGHGDHVPWEPCACVVPSLWRTEEGAGMSWQQHPSCPGHGYVLCDLLSSGKSSCLTWDLQHLVGTFLGSCGDMLSSAAAPFPLQKLAGCDREEVLQQSFPYSSGQWAETTHLCKGDP